MMENNEIPNQNIQGLIEMAIKEQLSWLTLASVLNELTPTITISKQIIKILLKELENSQSNLKEHIVEGSLKCEKSTLVMQNEETDIQFPDEDKLDFVNDVEIDQTDETFQNEDKDSKRFEKENDK